MKINFHTNFIKRYKKMERRLQEKTDRAIRRFRIDPFDPILKNHSLKGKMEGKRAFSVSSDIRVIFEAYDNYIFVIMLDVGTHTKVYGE